MLEQWIPLQRYKLLRATEDDATSPTTPSGRLSAWLALKRVRTALAVAVILLVLFSLSNFASLSPATFSQPFQTPVEPSPSTDSSDVRWSDFAYVQYITNGNYLCNSVMIVESLHRTGAKADRIMMYPKDWKISEPNDPEASIESKLLTQARDLYGAKLVPIQVQSLDKGDATWQDSFTKLLAFNQTQYKRVMSLDSDATVRMHMDELFLLPSAPVAMPRAYWLDQLFLSSQLVLVEPSATEWHRIQEFMNRPDPGFDMDILNSMYKDSCIIIPHKRYNMLSGEFRASNHEKYLGSDKEAWDGPTALEEAKFVHFSDWPVPKPWLQAPDSTMNEHQPKCQETKLGEQDCTDRNIWRSLYKDFSDRRQRICGRPYDKRQSRRSMSFVTAPKYEMILP